MSTIAVDNVKPSAGGTSYSLTDGVSKMVLLYNQVLDSVTSSTNVSSVTDNATGDFDTTLTNNMADATYSSAGSCGTNTQGGSRNHGIGARTTSGANHLTVTTANSATDCDENGAIFLGDLA